MKVGGLGVATLATGTGYKGFSEETADKNLRVGLIGTGWYGKVDLLRLIQVAPVDVVSLCDVDQERLDEAGEIVASRQV
jgi:predicted homoserine dehydrogenase-like protein